MSALSDAFAAAIAGRSLDAPEAERAFGEILDGGDGAPDALVAGLLVALRIKGEGAGELAGAARAMRARARTVSFDADVLDVVGTGGDGAGTFNISTGAALIAAAAGVPVAKHGNRAITGRVGAADVLEQMGVKIDLDPVALARCLRAAGMCFILAPSYHPVLARLGALRRALGVRTIFNLLGPLCNPSNPRRILLGVGDRKIFRPMAEAVAALGATLAIVVHGRDGLDEISLGAHTRVAEIRGASGIQEYEIAPEDFGIRRASAAELGARDPAHAAAVLRDALAGGNGPAQDVLALNAGAAIYAGGKAESLAAGVAAAREIISSGRALAVIERLVHASRGENP